MLNRWYMTVLRVFRYKQPSSIYELSLCYCRRRIDVISVLNWIYEAIRMRRNRWREWRWQSVIPQNISCSLEMWVAKNLILFSKTLEATIASRGDFVLLFFECISHFGLDFCLAAVLKLSPWTPMLKIPTKQLDVAWHSNFFTPVQDMFFSGSTKYHIVLR